MAGKGKAANVLQCNGAKYFLRDNQSQILYCNIYLQFSLLQLFNNRSRFLLGYWRNKVYWLAPLALTVSTFFKSISIYLLF